MYGLNWLVIPMLTAGIIAAAEKSVADPIHNAAIAGKLEKVRELIAKGADINAPHKTGTPLVWAILGNKEAVAKYLIKAGADPNIPGRSGTPLAIAALKQNKQLVRLLLANLANPNIGENSTPLINAAKKADADLAELLLQNGSNPDFATFDGSTALHAAASSGSLPVVTLLVRHGANVNAISKKGWSPLHIAVRNNRKTVSDFLVAEGAKPGMVERITGRLPGANVANGKDVAERTCEICHRLDPDAHGEAPSLWDIIGRDVASIASFNYTTQIRKFGGRWTYERLNRFIARPTEFVPGTRMEFSGDMTLEERADLIAYLRTLSKSPRPLPK